MIFVKGEIFPVVAVVKFFLKVLKRKGLVLAYVIGQLSSRTRHRVLAMAALDKSFSMVS